MNYVLYHFIVWEFMEIGIKVSQVKLDAQIYVKTRYFLHGLDQRDSGFLATQPKCKEYGRGLPKAMSVFRGDMEDMV